MDRKKVMVSGCFDLLHSGHIKFFEEANKLGNVYVQIGSDKTIKNLKNYNPMFPEEERLYLVQSCKYVYSAKISGGNGYLDFQEDLINIKPDIFFVNYDGDRKEKRELCKKYNIQYIINIREPKKGLISRSSTDIKKLLNIQEPEVKVEEEPKEESEEEEPEESEEEPEESEEEPEEENEEEKLKEESEEEDSETSEMPFPLMCLCDDCIRLSN
mgnify:CR=1 FL=1